MARYFFQVTGTAVHVDREGRELPDEQAAWALAIISTGELLRDLDGGMPDHARICTTVTDKRGGALISLTFTADRHGPALGESAGSAEKFAQSAQVLTYGKDGAPPATDD